MKIRAAQSLAVPTTFEVENVADNFQQQAEELFIAVTSRSTPLATLLVCSRSSEIADDTVQRCAHRRGFARRMVTDLDWLACSCRLRHLLQRLLPF